MSHASSVLRFLAAPALLSAAAIGTAASADSIGLVLQPAAPMVRAGSIIEVRLLVRHYAQGPWAAPQAQSFLALDVIAGWDPAKLEFLGITSTGSIPMLFSYLPSAAQDYTGLNEANPPADGDLFYTGATPLGQARNVTESDARVTTFRFRARAGSWTSADITLIPDRTVATYTETVVYDGTVPGLGVTGPLTNATIQQEFPSTWYRDADGDGFGDPGNPQVAFDRPTGFVAQAGDCDDSNAAIRPGAVENCANLALDNDCDGDTSADEAVDSGTYYADQDSDNFGFGVATKYCTPPAGWVANNQDCNDASNVVHPGAVETCADDGTDNDCDGEANADDEASDSVDYYVDGDQDGFGAGAATKSCVPIVGSVMDNADCNDASNAVFPGAPETCANDGTDNDCDGEASSDAEASDSTDYYVDGDQDGFGAGAATKSCTPVVGSVLDNTDCDDASNAAYPGAPETCANDGTDNDCDGEANSDAEASDSIDYYVDGDQDGFGAGQATKGCSPIAGSVTNNADCSDASNAVFPGAPEDCANDGIDNDCDGEANSDAEASDSIDYYVDGDQDGFGAGQATKGCNPIAGSVTDNTDCDDASNAVFPGAPETCANDGTDNDCDGEASSDAEASDSASYYVDGDQDGFGAGAATKSCTPVTGSVTDNTDCDDTRFLYVDADGDGFGAGAAVACGVASNSDNCPSTPNADQANLDGDSMGDVCDPDIDNDGVMNANDAFPRDASQSAATAAMGTTDLSSFLAGASAAVVNAGGMSADQLAIVIGSIARVVTINSLTLTAGQDAMQMGTLLGATAAGQATIVATGMGSSQLAAAAAAPAAIGSVTGRLAVDAGMSDALILFLVGRAAPSALVAVDPLGMDSLQLQALQVAPAVVLSAIGPVAVGSEITVRADAYALPTAAVGAQLHLVYDAARLEFVAADPSDDMPVVISAVDQASTVAVQTAIAGSGNGSTAIVAGNVAKLRFRARVPFCNVLDCVGLTAGSSVNTLATGQSSPASVDFVGINVVRVSGMDMPAIAGVPSNAEVPADAGTVAGAAVASAGVSASNACGPVPVTLSVALADGGSASSWPAMFPVGVSTVTWRAEDAAGNVKTEQATVTVRNVQLATIDVRLGGTMSGPSGGFTQQVRVRTSAGDIVNKDVQFSGAGLGALADVEVPVAMGYTCISVKDAGHTLATSNIVPVSGTKYAPAAYVLAAGDGNDDNMVDILDFGLFVSHWGGPRLPTDPSNYNRDGAVNSGDFTFISAAFLSQGAACGGAFSGGMPRERISVRDLRRMGLGDLAVADFNRDGWVDTADIAIFMKRGMQQPAGSPVDRMSGSGRAD